MLKTGSTSSVIRETQMKTTVRCHFTPTRMVIIQKKKKTITSVDEEDVEKLESSHMADEM